MTVFETLDPTKLAKLSMMFHRDGVSYTETLIQLEDGTWDLIVHKPTVSIVEVNGVEHTYLFDSTSILHDMARLKNFEDIKTRAWSKLQYWNEATKDWEIVWEAP